MVRKKDDIIMEDRMYLRSVQVNTNSGLPYLYLPKEVLEQMGMTKSTTVCLIFRPAQMVLEIRPESEQLKFKSPKKDTQCPTKNSSGTTSKQ